jgi:SDR family mycofactocin-dependent oxidoreductase
MSDETVIRYSRNSADTVHVADAFLRRCETIVRFAGKEVALVERLKGKVAFVTGAARGQGRAHAVRMAQEGADIIAVDICHDISSNRYPLATPEDLMETERLVKEQGRQIVARPADVRERSELRDALTAGLSGLGHLDIVVANAGIMPMAPAPADAQDFVDATDVDLLGVMNTVAVSHRHVRDHGSIVLTGSTAGMISGATSHPSFGPGGAGYQWSKQVLQQYTEQMALHLAHRFVRVNCIHPTNCNTDLLHNKEMYKVFRPDMDDPTRDDAEVAFAVFQAMPIPWVEPDDVANLAVFLASDESRYITGEQIRIDAGALIKWGGKLSS